MNISLPDPMRDWVQSRIENGQYASVSDYVRDLIRRDQTQTVERANLLKSLDANLDASLADAKAGRIVNAETVFDELEGKYRSLARMREDR